jgi:uncharacterized membrane protein/predicted DsbA family dithiol-disulfide isomerase
VIPPSASRVEQRGSAVVPRLATVFTLLCLVGLAVSIELTRVHFLVHTDPGYRPACAVSEAVSCATVALSPYSVYGGLPVSVWGIAGYLGMGALAASGVSRRSRGPGWPFGLLLPVSAFSVVVSGVLAYVSATRIASLCMYCLFSQLTTGALLVVAAVAWRRSHLRLGVLLLGDARAFLGGRFELAMVALVCAALATTRWSIPTYWKPPDTWAERRAGSFGTDGAGLRWIGAEEPSLVVVEFSDYECPYCRGAHRRLRQFTGGHPGVRLVHRHLPLDMACNPGLRQPFHLRACLFAEAAECAGLQGRFWEMNDALIAVQDGVPAEQVDVARLAVRIGLDRGRFQSCLEEHKTLARIAADVEEGAVRGLRATPTYLVRGRYFVGEIPEQDLEAMLRAEAP